MSALLNEIPAPGEVSTSANNALSTSPSVTREGKKAGATEAMRRIPKLLDACRWGHFETAETLGQEVANAIESSHPAIAEQIKKRLATKLRPIKQLRCPDDLLDLREARHGLSEVILPEAIERECAAIISEHHRADELARFKLAPRHKALLYGPPGNGKTLLAEALAKELDIPFMPVKYAGLVDSHLGATGKNLQKIFDYAETGPCVIFMDEFDGVAIDRSDSKDVGEIRRVTNQLLIRMDRLPPSCVFIAATNAETLLDRAAHRRFDFVMEIPAPTLELKLRCAKRELAPELTPGHDVSHHAETVAQLELLNLSALVQLCQRIRRDLVLNGGRGVPSLILEPVGSSA